MARKPQWRTRDDARASAEGWALFHCDGATDERAARVVDGKPYGDRPIELQRDDAADYFAEDCHAWQWVARRAADGNKLAARALAYLAEFSPAERDAIREATGY